MRRVDVARDSCNADSLARDRTTLHVGARPAIHGASTSDRGAAALPMPHPSDNPVWAALTSAHAHLAVGDARAVRYPSDVAPFVAVAFASDDPDIADAVAGLVAPGEVVDFVGVLPPDDARFHVEEGATALQMDYTGGVRDDEGEFTELMPSDIGQMLALTQLVYPFYFRKETPRMGRWYGVFDSDGRLVSMAGERMRTETHCEISGVCTHPDFLGRGLARRLVQHAANEILARGEQALLHVSPKNTRAVKLYESMGFETVRELALVQARRL